MPRTRWPLIFAALLLVVEFAVIGILFKHGIDFYCLDNWPPQACKGASQTLVSLYCILGAMSLLFVLQPEPFRQLLSHAGGRNWALGLNLLGASITLIPLAFLENGAGQWTLFPAFLSWIVGMSCILAGLGLYIAPLSAWRGFISQTWTKLIPVILTGAIAPYFAILIRPIWRIDSLASGTFHSVVWILRQLGYDIETFEGSRIIGVDPFYINVAPACSGVEGIALVTLFVTLYLSLFRKDLRFPHAFLLYPIGIATSVLFNMLRIAILLAIGIEGSPELAVGGFHSHAGWLLFTLIALGIVLAAQSVPALQRRSAHGVQDADIAHAQPHQPFFRDPVVARILPFALFMLSALLASTFSQSPGVVYPLRVIVMAGVLALFWQVYRGLHWRIDPVALAVGLGIGLMWILLPVAASDGPPPYGALVGMTLVIWFVLRGVGTILLVPLIEELFFRGYLETRLRLGTGVLWTWIAALITASLFALLHDRWAEAFVAGLLFSWVKNRNGHVIDAVVSHAIANALIYAVAVLTGNLSII